jgi:hypothetical protein
LSTAPGGGLYTGPGGGLYEGPGGGLYRGIGGGAYAGPEEPIYMSNIPPWDVFLQILCEDYPQYAHLAYRIENAIRL